MPYERSRAQKAWLVKYFAEQSELALENCDCAGCNICSGFQAGCSCDISAAQIPLFREGRTDNGTVRKEQERGLPRSAPKRRRVEYRSVRESVLGKNPLHSDQERDEPGTEPGESYPF